MIDLRPLRRLSLAGLILALAACSGETGSAVTAVRDSAGVRIVENHPGVSTDTCAVSDTPAVTIGVRSGPAPYELFRVMDGALLSEGGVAVVNQGSHEVRIYGPEGEFRHAIGSQGEGPGEFRRVFLVWSLPGDTLVVGDYRPWRFSWFTASGSFLRSSKPRPLYPNSPDQTGVLADGTSVLGSVCCRSPEPGFHRQQLHLLRHDRSGGLVDTLGVWETRRVGVLHRGERSRFVGGPVFEARAVMAAAGRTVAVAPKGEREVRLMEPDGTLRALVRWTGPDREVTREHVEAYRDRVRARYEGQPEEMRRYGEPQISPDRPVADRFPAKAGLELGPEGEIWLRRYPRPGTDGADDMRWLVFDPEGRFLCHATTPPALERPWDLFEIGRERLLGQGKTELDVEQVLLFPLDRPDSGGP